MKTKHTPGPWNFSTHEVGSQYSQEEIWSSKESVAIVLPNNPSRLANARLIASAPELLQACEAFIEAWDKCLQLEKTDTALRMARQAVRKAKGE